MRGRRLALWLLLVATLAQPGAAQEPGVAAKGVPPDAAGEPPRPPPRPETGSASDTGDARPPSPTDRPAPLPERASPLGAEDARMPSLSPTDRPAPPPVGAVPPEIPVRSPSDAQTPPEAPAQPSSGALIPPEAYAEPVVPFGVASGPPAPELLRESDFDHAACRLGLAMLGVDYAEAAPLTDPDQRDCGIARPVALRAIQPGVTVEGAPVLRCDTARALALWMREMVIPAAARLPGSPRLTSVALGTGYACRGVVGGDSKARVSEHALGNAIDIAAFGLDDGARIEVGPPGERGDLGVAFQNAVQGSACLYFTTVLGPGSNAAHDDHLHLDIKARRGGLRLCQ